MVSEQLERTRLTSRGLAGDRVWGLVDEGDREGRERQTTQSLGRVFELKATGPGGVQVTLPDGRGWDGSRLNMPAFYEAHSQPACTSAGLGRVRFHDLRHTYASLMAHQGEDLYRVSKWMGHSTIAITADLYTHLFQGGPGAAEPPGRALRRWPGSGRQRRVAPGQAHAVTGTNLRRMPQTPDMHMRFGLLLAACSGTFALGSADLIGPMLLMAFATVMFAVALVADRQRQ
jgi:hypothetical protein